MNSSQIRQSFLDFFASKQHTIVPSASLMPTSPNLLFTNSGMNQFVPFFLGEKQPHASRIADTQKCIRAGGKHNDLDDVGYDGYHHTFFEMLGNWSFGDYFKKESILWAWELLTVTWKFPKNRLYATVYRPQSGDPSEFDQEAYDIWHDLFIKEGLDPKQHICEGGKKDNFWMMGETGPCGPCSELHIDLTPEGGKGHLLVNKDSPWCIELWNLVFIQFNATEDGKFLPLPSRHVDTGMGFERIAGVIATTKNFTDFSNPPSNYNADLFQAIFAHISSLSGLSYGFTLPKDRNHLTPQEMTDCAFRVLADHIRTLSFSIADGILPGNEGRNYVLRRILRRAVLFGKRLQLPHGFFVTLLDPLIKVMGSFFPELVKRQQLIHNVLENEEKVFEKTLDRGLALLDSILDKSPQILSGSDAFTLYDTYGFPLDLTEIIAHERGISVDKIQFNEKMEEQRIRAKSAQNKTTITVVDKLSLPPTLFVGYDRNSLTQFPAKLLSTLPADSDHTYLIFDATPFYAEMGGQLGDSGTLQIPSHPTPIQILKTLKDPSGVFLHLIKNSSALDLNIDVTLSVDLSRRLDIHRNHSATHLLHCALRTILGDHVVQAGSLVSNDYLRFDFNHFKQITPSELTLIESFVNQKIIENHFVHSYEIPIDQKPDDVIAFFEEKYGSLVRVVDIGGFSKELCGGTHVQYTGEIGFFKIQSESAIAAGIRRIEAISGSKAISFIQSTFHQLHLLSHKLSCSPNELPNRLDLLLNQKDDLTKKIRSYEQKDLLNLSKNLIPQIHQSNGIQLLRAVVPISNPDDMRSFGAQILNHMQNGIVILGSKIDSEKANLVVLCSQGAISLGHNANTIIRTLTAQLDGKGGGKADFAMGGAKNVDQLQSVIENCLNN